MALTNFGNVAFTLSGVPKYFPSGWDLDRLIVPYRGPISVLTAYLDSLTMWTPHTSNGNMFLADYAVDGHEQYPTVSHVYIGKRNGASTPAQTRRGRSVQSSSVSQHSGTSSLDMSVIFNAASYSATQIARDRTPPPLIDPPEVIASDLISVQWRVVNGTVSGSVFDFFVQQVTVGTESEELVPDTYYRNTITKTRTLLGLST